MSGFMDIPNDLWLVFNPDGRAYTTYESHCEAQDDEFAKGGQPIFQYTRSGMVPEDLAKKEDEWNDRLEELERSNERLLAALGKMRDYADTLLDDLAAEDSADLAQKPTDTEKPPVSR